MVHEKLYCFQSNLITRFSVLLQKKKKSLFVTKWGESLLFALQTALVQPFMISMAQTLRQYETGRQNLFVLWYNPRCNPPSHQKWHVMMQHGE
jgi:hypothetical protein